MKITLTPPIAAESKPKRERRRDARVKLSCFILVRPLDPASEYFESIILTNNSCRNGLNFQTDNALYCQRMRLLVTFPYSRCPGAINRDYIAEVVGKDADTDDGWNVAVRFLTTAKLSIPLTSKMCSSNVWDALWQRAKAETRHR